MHLPIDATIGERIRYYRQVAGITQKQLAEACELSEPAIRNYELGNRIPDRDTLTSIAAELKVSYFALANPILNANGGAIQTFFRLERIYGLHPVEVNGKIMLALPDAPSVKEILKDPMVVLNNPGNLLVPPLEQWHEVYRMYSSGEIDEEAYLHWQSKFPDYAYEGLPTPATPTHRKKEKRMRKPKA